MSLHPALDSASSVLELELPGLSAAAEVSGRQLTEARSFFKQQLGGDDPLDIVVCGSLARREMSGASDFDYLIVAHGLVDDAARLREFRRACDAWCTARAIRPPGATGVFGTVVSATDLVEQIGLEFDTNHSLTRRILLLEEGVSTLRPALHERFVTVAISRYLAGEEPGETSISRFMLNDIARYWWTIAVDYQAKVWQRLDTRAWAIRYLKLRISRKLTFAASVVPPLLLMLRRIRDRPGFLTEQYVELPPLARLAQLVDDLRSDPAALGHLRAILTIADRFVSFLADEEKRERVEQIASPAQAAAVPEFVEMSELSRELQSELTGLFLDSTLGPAARKHLMF